MGKVHRFLALARLSRDFQAVKWVPIHVFRTDECVFVANVVPAISIEMGRPTPEVLPYLIPLWNQHEPPLVKEHMHIIPEAKNI